MTLRAVSGTTVAAVLAVVVWSPARAANPLDELIKPELNSSACFARVYDAAHLRAHPQQKPEPGVAPRRR
jgi:hypothetical protein